MSTRAPCLLLIATLLVFAVDAQAEDANDMGWGGFGVGTMIHLQSTQDIQIPGMAPQKLVTETKKTLLRITDKAYVLKVEEMEGGAWTSKEVTVPKIQSVDALAGLLPGAMGQNLKREELGKENVKVDGKSYECTKLKVTVPSGPMGAMTTTVWEHPEHGLLKMKTSGAMGGMGATTMEVTKLDAEVKVGDVALVCKASTMTVGGTGVTTKRLESTQVPEGLVRSEMTMKQGPMKTTTKEELVAFVKK